MCIAPTTPRQVARLVRMLRNARWASPRTRWIVGFLHLGHFMIRTDNHLDVGEAFRICQAITGDPMVTLVAMPAWCESDSDPMDV